MKYFIIICFLGLIGCADTMRKASYSLGVIEEYQKDNMIWILDFDTIYFGGDILGKNKSVLHNSKSLDACKSFNENVFLLKMVESGLLAKRINCVPYYGQDLVSEGLYVKQTANLSMVRQDYYYVDHIDLSTGHIIKRQDIIEAGYKEYSGIWLFNVIIPIITASKQTYNNDIEWEKKMNSICNNYKSEYCSL